MDPSKPLTRNTRDKWLAGVCGGLARYLGMDANLLRIICLILFLAAPALILVYLVLVFVLPADDGSPAPLGATAENFATATRDKKSSETLLGIILITAGVIFLFNNLFRWIGWRELWPVLLIVAGLYLLLNTPRDRATRSESGEVPPFSESDSSSKENDPSSDTENSTP
ncbi:MAG: PspC domain-containing protein [Chlorobi bacterium]|nr:PspC domain-containing protein [Chlorobiota bacterium]